MPKPEKVSHTTVRKRSQAEVFPLEVEHLLEVLARIEARRQRRLRALEGRSVNATPEIPS